jgi:hypothetical protein
LQPEWLFPYGLANFVENQPESTGSGFKEKTFEKESGLEIGPNGLTF